MEIINKIGKYRLAGRFWYERDVDDVAVITVHHTASRATGTNDEILQSIMNTHTNNGWPGLAYHFVILKDGSIYQINEFKEVTWHDTHNYDSIGVCLHGYFHPEYNETPTREQLLALDFLLDQLCTQHPEFPADHDDVRGHRERSSTACPGDLLFPKVVEYRTKLGDVDWGSNTSPISESVLRKLPIMWDDAEGKRHEVEWYVSEWWVEKQKALGFKKESDTFSSELSICQSKLNQKNGWFEDLTKQVGIMQNHVETIQKSFSEFGHNQSLLTSTIKTIQDTVNTLRDALTASYEVWQKEKSEKDTKIAILDGSVTKLLAENESLNQSLEKERNINAKDIETIPNSTIRSEFFKMIFGKRRG